MLDLDDWPDLNFRRAPRTILPQAPRTYKPPRTTRPRLFKSTTPPATILDSQDVGNSSRGVKRQRPLEEIAETTQVLASRKRRRLRRAFTTSRLSPDYAAPASHVPGRRFLRQGIWARQRVSGRDLLRRAAVFNASLQKRKAQRRPETKSAPSKSEPSCLTWSNLGAERSRSLSQYSKLSAFSEYETIDYEDESESEEDDNPETPTSIHSDFGKIQDGRAECGPPVDDYAFDSPLSLGTDDVYTFDPGGKALGIILENEKRSEVSVFM